MFENEIIRGIHISRYVMSWYKKGGTRRQFRNWLLQLRIDGEALSADEIRRIFNFADNGKLELEMDAARFIDLLKKPKDEA